MRPRAVLILAGLVGLAGVANADCPPRVKCPPPPPPPPARAPAPPRPFLRPLAPHVFTPMPSQTPKAPSSLPLRTPRNPVEAPTQALMIHRGAGGYSRRYVGASSTAALGARPRRKEGGPTYLYHGRRYAPIWAPRYHWPRGHPYHRFHRHDRFPRIFLIPEYFIDDYDDYDLAPPPLDAQWVRYGDDLVLVDLDNGDILNVVTGFFAESGDETVAPEDDGAPPDESPPGDPSPPPDDHAPPAEPPQFMSFSAR